MPVLAGRAKLKQGFIEQARPRFTDASKKYILAVM
jgi:hypothetical protein